MLFRGPMDEHIANPAVACKVTLTDTVRPESFPLT